jgi:F-type H+-transporting ATPase subunit b
MSLMQQLGELVLGSVPTMVLFLLTLAAYLLLVHFPLRKTLRERQARTQGVIENADAILAAVEAKTAEYEERLRTARASVFHERHERLNQVRMDSEIMLADARAAAQERVTEALLEIDKSATTARLQLEGSIHALAADALRAVLPPLGATAQERMG